MPPHAPGGLTALYLGDGMRRTRRGLWALRRALRGGRRRLHFFHRVDSPKSFLLAQALEPFLDAYPFELSMTVVPAPAADFDPEPHLRARLDRREAPHVAALYGLRFPEDAAAPHEARVRMANAVLLKDRPPRAQLALAIELSRALFADDGEALHRLSDAEGGVRGQDVRPRLEENYRRLRAAGHFDDGALFHEGEWYVGVDRLHHLEARLLADRRDDGAPRLVRPAVPPAPQDPKRRVPVEVYYTFRSPYSYIALELLGRAHESYPMELALKPTLPLVMRGLSVPAEKERYVVVDAAREALRHGIPFGRLRDPIGAPVERCLALARVASREDRALSFARSAMRAIWSEAADLTHPESLDRVLERAGLADPEASSATMDAGVAAWVESNREALVEAGLWAAPSFRVGDAIFFGHERVPAVLAEVVRLSEQ